MYEIREKTNKNKNKEEQSALFIWVLVFLYEILPGHIQDKSLIIKEKTDLQANKCTFPAKNLVK